MRSKLILALSLFLAMTSSAQIPELNLGRASDKAQAKISSKEDLDEFATLYELYKTNLLLFNEACREEDQTNSRIHYAELRERMETVIDRMEAKYISKGQAHGSGGTQRVSPNREGRDRLNHMMAIHTTVVQMDEEHPDDVCESAEDLEAFRSLFWDELDHRAAELGIQLRTEE